jgi:hypothetical protein
MPREMVEIVYVVSLRRSYWMLEKVSRYHRCVDWRCELCSGATMYGYPTPCHDINERPISRNSQTPADDRSWLRQTKCTAGNRKRVGRAYAPLAQARQPVSLLQLVT